MFQRTGATGKFWHRRKHSVEFDPDLLQEELNQDAARPAEDSDIPSFSEAACTPSSSVQVQDAGQIQQQREEWAATRIQTAFRGFLVRLYFYIFIYLFFILGTSLLYLVSNDGFSIGLFSFWGLTFFLIASFVNEPTV